MGLLLLFSREPLLSESPIQALQKRFALPGIAQIVAGNNGLPKIQITSASATAEIYLHGAQVTSWRPMGTEEVLFLSRHSRWEDGRAIRGGIPICFPWFRAKTDDPKAPAHGAVRTRSWQLDSVEEQPSGVVVELSTESDDATGQWYPHKFRLVHRVTVGAALKLELIATNTGDSPLRLEEALHTYLRVADATLIRVSGLDGARFLDNMDGNREKTQEGDIRFRAPTDSAYLDTRASLELIDPGLGRRIRTGKENSLTTVVWNPWEQGASALADLGDEEWRQMACVEASNILGAAVEIAPGERHILNATLEVAPSEEIGPAWR